MSKGERIFKTNFHEHHEIILRVSFVAKCCFQHKTGLSNFNLSNFTVALRTKSHTLMRMVPNGTPYIQPFIFFSLDHVRIIYDINYIIYLMVNNEAFSNGCFELSL